MFTILRNLVFNEIRRQKRKPTTSADAIEEEGGAILFLEGSQSPDAALQQTELQQAVDDAIAPCRKRRAWPSNSAALRTCLTRK